MSITETDLAIAAAIYPVLVDRARQFPLRKLPYGELVDEIKSRFPNVDAVQTAIPVSLGRRLDVVRLFLSNERLPNLTSLIVNAGTGEVGSAFGSEPEKVRAQVAAFDWSAVSEHFDLHIAGLQKNIAARAKPKLTRDAAKVAMADYYRDTAYVCPKTLDKNARISLKLSKRGCRQKMHSEKWCPTWPTKRGRRRHELLASGVIRKGWSGVSVNHPA